jgi:HD-GYP domain-containing protein (c-di-GMP phosphodiesterase class II)
MAKHSANFRVDEPDSKSEPWLKAVFRAFPDILFHLQSNGAIDDYLTSNTSALFVSPKEFLGKRMQDVLPADVGQRMAQAIERVNQTNEIVSLEYQLTVPAGVRYYEARLVPLPKSEIVIIVRDITVQKEGEERNRRQLQRLAALRSIDTAIVGNLDLHLTLEIIIEHLMKQLGADAADILLISPHSQRLEIAAGHGFQTASLHRTNLLVGEGFAGRAAYERRIVSIPDLQVHTADTKRFPVFSREKFVSCCAAPLISKGQLKGVLEVFFRFSYHPDTEWLDFFETLADQAAIAIDSVALFNDLQRSNMEYTLAYDLMIEGWASALDLRNHISEGHSRRVTELTIKLASRLGLGEKELGHIRRGALLHDVGKVRIPDKVLFKAGALTSEEWEIMRQHPLYARTLLHSIPYLHRALDIPYCHHEKWDGTGYPQGLKGEAIPMSARIFAVADVFDTLTCERPYRPAWSREKALEYVCANAGTHFDPKVVAALQELGLAGLQNN